MRPHRIKWLVSFAAYRLFYRALLQKRRLILRRTSRTSDLEKKRKDETSENTQSAWTLVRPLWHAVAPGLKPLRLPRAQLRVIFRQEPLIIGFFCGKWPGKDKAFFECSPPFTHVSLLSFTQIIYLSHESFTWIFHMNLSHESFIFHMNHLSSTRAWGIISAMDSKWIRESLLCIRNASENCDCEM